MRALRLWIAFVLRLPFFLFLFMLPPIVLITFLGERNFSFGQKAAGVWFVVVLLAVSLVVAKFDDFAVYLRSSRLHQGHDIRGDLPQVRPAIVTLVAGIAGWVFGLSPILVAFSELIFGS